MLWAVWLSCFVVLHWRLAAATSTQDCHVSPSFSSVYVSAYIEQRSQVAGCTTRRRTAAGAQEVHIINLRSGGAHVQHHGPTVTLQIKPRHDEGTFEGPLIFVLKSHRVVTWKIRTERIGNSARHIFMITRGSHVIRDRRISMRVMARDNIPFNNEDLMQWAKRRYHAVTSFADILTANYIYKSVGIDPRSPEECKVRDAWQVAPLSAFYRQPQETQGCDQPNNEGINGREVHIIEIHHADSPLSRGNRDVVIDLATRGRRQITKHVVLILKGHSPIIWKIQSDGLNGMLDIIAPNSNITGTKAREVVVHQRKSDIHHHGQQLVEYVTESYGPPVSYIQAQHANRVNLLIYDERGPPKSKLENRTPESSLNSTNGRNSSQGNSSSSSSLSPTSSSEEVKVEEEEGRKRKKGVADPNLPFADPVATLNALRRAITTRCHNMGMDVALQKSKLRAVGLTARHLTLLDPRCGARSNRTHIKLSTLLAECDTRTTGLTSDKPRYANAVVVRRIEGVAGEAEEGSGPPGGATEASGMQAGDDTHWDDEDYHIPMINVSFHCEFKIGVDRTRQTADDMAVEVETGNLENVSSHLTLYGSSDFSTPLTHFPHPVTEKQRIFVDVRLIAEPQLRVLVRNCYVSSLADKQKKMLIQNGCNSDKSLQWHGQTSHNRIEGQAAQRQRFSFQIYKYFHTGSYQMNLHCELDVCSNSDARYSLGVKKCVEQVRYCIMEASNAGMARSLQTSLKAQVGPLLMPMPQSTRGPELRTGMGRPDITKQVRAPKGSSGGDGAAGKEEQCVQVIRVEGLDSGTVVGIAFAAFLIGVMLTAALWFIHTHTGPINRPQRSLGSEGSGESTPSSSAPIST